MYIGDFLLCVLAMMFTVHRIFLSVPVVLFPQASLKRMLHVFAASTPFKIFYAIIGFDPVQMINMWLVFRVRNKRRGHEAMSCTPFLNIVDIERIV